MPNEPAEANLGDAAMAADPSYHATPDWEAFYASYRKPGYVPGFEILHKLGGGAFGIVFQARKQSIGKDYAIKFLKLDETGEVRKGVLAELDSVRHFAQVDHPNLVAIEDRGEVDGIPYLVMNFAGSTTLKDLLPPADSAAREELRRLFLQACRGVAALHDHGLVHFDLKPGNIFVKGGVARVGDYGLSRLLSHSRASLSMGRGTPYYMAPELLERRGDQRSDIYSLGVMLYEILVGRVPFTGDSEWEVLEKHRREMPEFPGTLSTIERDVLMRALAKDPADRFESASALMTALGVAPAGAFTSHSAPPPLEPTRPRTTTPQEVAAAKDKLKRAAKDAGDAARTYARHAAERARDHARRAVDSARAMAESAGVAGDGLDPASLDKEPLPVALAKSHWHAWRTRREAKRAFAATRRPRRRGALMLVLVGFGISLLLAGAWVMGAPRPRPVMLHAANSNSSSAVQVTKIGVLDSLHPNFRSRFLLGRADWSSEQSTRNSLGRSRLLAHLARFRSVIPQFEQAYVDGGQADLDFDHIIAGYLEPRPTQHIESEAIEVRALIRDLLSQESTAAAHGAAAERLRATGSFGLATVARQLQELVRGVQTGESSMHRDVLDGFLRESVDFDSIPPMREVSDNPVVAERQQAARAVLWRWFLWEFARDDAMLEKYRRLRGSAAKQR